MAAGRPRPDPPPSLPSQSAGGWLGVRRILLSSGWCAARADAILTCLLRRVTAVPLLLLPPPPLLSSVHRLSRGQRRAAGRHSPPALNLASLPFARLSLTAAGRAAGHDRSGRAAAAAAAHSERDGSPPQRPGRGRGRTVPRGLPAPTRMLPLHRRSKLRLIEAGSPAGGAAESRRGPAPVSSAGAVPDRPAVGASRGSSRRGGGRVNATEVLTMGQWLNPEGNRIRQF